MISSRPRPLVFGLFLIAIHCDFAHAYDCDKKVMGDIKFYLGEAMKGTPPPSAGKVRSDAEAKVDKIIDDAVKKTRDSGENITDQYRQFLMATLDDRYAAKAIAEAGGEACLNYGVTYFKAVSAQLLRISKVVEQPGIPSTDYNDLGIASRELKKAVGSKPPAPDCKAGESSKMAVNELVNGIHGNGIAYDPLDAFMKCVASQPGANAAPASTKGSQTQKGRGTR